MLQGHLTYYVLKKGVIFKQLCYTDAHVSIGLLRDHNGQSFEQNLPNNGTILSFVFKYNLFQCDVK